MPEDASDPRDCRVTHDSGVVVAGHICLDVIPELGYLAEGQFAESFHPGGVVTIGSAIFCTGGAVANTGLSLHRLGMPVRLAARVGADPFGKVVRELVEQHGAGLADGLRVDGDEATSYSLVISPLGVDRFVLHCRGANNTFSTADVDLDLVARASVFHFGYPTAMRRMYSDGGAELVEMLRAVKSTGATTSLDMAQLSLATESGRADWRVILGTALPYVDIFMPTFEEIYFALHREDLDRLRRSAPGDDLVQAVTPELLAGLGAELLSMGVKAAGIKLGGRGLYLRTAGAGRLAAMGRAAPKDLPAWADREVWAPSFEVQMVGTTGAGDAAIAGFLCALLRGLSADQAVTAAAAVGACAVEAADALSGVRTWEETAARIQSGWARRPLALDAPGWQWDEAAQLWVGPGNSFC